ncbi:MAG: sulfatase-like hydrolase/transferase [Ruminococcus sp.]|nr:sulfatase-like hydrolase/transferase [Ruminococcus sp.]
MIKKYSKILFITFLIIYLELITKFIVLKTFNGIFYTLIFSISLIIFINFITGLFKEKHNNITLFIITFLLSLYYGFQGIFYRLFSNIFSINTLSLASDIGEFKTLIIDILTKNTICIALYIIPIIILTIIYKKLNVHKITKYNIIYNVLFIAFFYFLSLATLYYNKENTYSPYNLYYNINSEIKTVETFGLATYTRLDIKRTIWGFNEIINNEMLEIQEELDEPEEITYNEISINFEDLINNESDENIKNILEYFKNSEPTNKNTYTGMFKDKNLIFILAEGFNMIAVDEELTPTLYKLTHEGFVFNNFYSPVFLSTTGGEFQAMTGLLPTQETLTLWKKKKTNIHYALGNSFNRLDYYTSSYHDWTHTYYSRQNTMPTLGFDNYLACGNGLEKSINCKWLPSDIDMINATLPLYKDNDNFMTYYISVSGHAPYVYNSNGNSIAKKNTDLVKDLPYSNNVKAYLATQIEFDRALETLIKSLEEEGILDDTVISFVGDHYPYTLTVDEINELSTYDRDEIIEVNRSDFVIWNNKMKEPITIDKVGSEIDVLPTLLNLFGIEYDSRLIMGKDILSNTPGLAIFSNRSWVSDYGTYNRGKLTLKDNVELDNIDEYIKEIDNIVNNRFSLSNQIIKYNMYDYILKK